MHPALPLPPNGPEPCEVRAQHPNRTLMDGIYSVYFNRLWWAWTTGDPRATMRHRATSSYLANSSVCQTIWNQDQQNTIRNTTGGYHLTRNHPIWTPKPRAQQTQDSIPTESPKFLPKTQQKKINKRPEATNGRTQPTHSKGLSHRTETPFMNPRKLEPNKPKTGFPRNNRNSHWKSCQNDPTVKEHGTEREQGNTHRNPTSNNKQNTGKQVEQGILPRKYRANTNPTQNLQKRKAKIYPKTWQTARKAEQGQNSNKHIRRNTARDFESPHCSQQTCILHIANPEHACAAWNLAPWASQPHSIQSRPAKKVQKARLLKWTWQNHVLTTLNPILGDPPGSGTQLGLGTTRSRNSSTPTPQSESRTARRHKKQNC